VAPSKYLGHYVAGNLAARHGITIQLRESPGSGITATVDLPPALVTTDAPGGTAIPDPHDPRAVPSVPSGQPGVLGGPPAVPPHVAAFGPGQAGHQDLEPALPGKDDHGTGGPALADRGVSGYGPGPDGSADPGFGQPGVGGHGNGGPAPADRVAGGYGPGSDGSADPGFGQPGAGGRGNADPAFADRGAIGYGPGPDGSAPPEFADSGAGVSGEDGPGSGGNGEPGFGELAGGNAPGGAPGWAAAMPADTGFRPADPSSGPPTMPAQAVEGPPGGAPGWAAAMSADTGFRPGDLGSGPPTMPAQAVGGPFEAAAEGPPNRTASGLVKRTRRSHPESRRRPANIPSGELLTALQGHTGKVPTPDVRSDPRPEFHPAPRHEPEQAAEGTTPSGLVRRVRGAQMPAAEPRSLKRGDRTPSPAPRPAPPPAPGGVQPPPGSDDGAARDVYGFLSSFSSGVQRGLDESRGQ
jgi:hypothetical protein